MDAEDLAMELYDSGARLPSLLNELGQYGSFMIDVNSEFWQFLEDPSRSGKYATAALAYFKCLAKDEFRCCCLMVIHLHFFFNQSAKLDELVDLVLQVGWHEQYPKFRTYEVYPEILRRVIREYLARVAIVITALSQSSRWMFIHSLMNSIAI